MKETYVIHQAGGASAYSAFLFTDGLLSPLLAVDSDDLALLEWKHVLGVKTLPERDYKFDPKRHVLLACDEVYRLRHPGVPDGRFCIGDVRKIHDKLLAHQALEHATEVEVPQVIRSGATGLFVHRERLSSGCRGTKILRHALGGEDTIVTRYIEFDAEYVVDFYRHDKVGIQVAPRVTHRLRYGEDTFTTLIGWRNRDYEKIRRAAAEIADLLGLDKIGMVQLGKKDDRFVFIEAAARISGSSFLNMLVGFNPFAGMLGGFAYDPPEKDRMVSVRTFWREYGYRRV